MQHAAGLLVAPIVDNFALQIGNYRQGAVVQAHCHHKAIMRLYDDEAVMKKMGLDFQMLNAGCCGMAGSF